MQISSVHNPRVKAAAKLRDRQSRDEQQRFIVDGRREIARALDAQLVVLECYYRPESCDDPPTQQLVERLRQSDAAMFEVTSEVLAKLTYGQRDEGLVIVAQPRYYELEQLVPDIDPLFVVLDRLEKPGNLGAVLRTAHATGVNALILTDALVDPYNPNVIRSSLGAVFHTPVCSVSATEASAWLAKQKVRLFAARVEARHSYFGQDFLGPTAFILGSESQGLAEHWSGGEIQEVYLPMCGSLDSLNVSVTTAVLLYEALRQRWQASA